MLKQLGLALLFFAIFSSLLHAETKQTEKFPFFPSLLGTVSGKPI